MAITSRFSSTSRAIRDSRLAFLPLAAGSSAAVWGLTSLLTFRWLSPAPALFQAALTAALYPLAAAALSALRRAVPDPDDS